MLALLEVKWSAPRVGSDQLPVRVMTVQPENQFKRILRQTGQIINDAGMSFVFCKIRGVDISLSPIREREAARSIMKIRLTGAGNETGKEYAKSFERSS